MPQFEIHDSDTGFKLLVEGPSEPSERESSELVQEELKFLSTNLYRATDNRFMLDVGPLTEMRRSSEGMTEARNELARSGRSNMAFFNAKSRYDAIRATGEDWGEGDVSDLWDRILQEEDAKAQLSGNPLMTTTQSTLLRLEPNTLLILAHGQEQGGLLSEGGQPFTLNNIAQMLGARSNDVRNVINTACYGGAYCPADYQAVFPNVTNISQTGRNDKNVTSLERMASGSYFFTNTIPGVWNRIGTNWNALPALR